jgi:hypothetical protein
VLNYLELSIIVFNFAKNNNMSIKNQHYQDFEWLINFIKCKTYKDIYIPKNLRGVIEVVIDDNTKEVKIIKK